MPPGSLLYFTQGLDNGAIFIASVSMLPCSQRAGADLCFVSHRVCRCPLGHPRCTGSVDWEVAICGPEKSCLRHPPRGLHGLAMCLYCAGSQQRHSFLFVTSDYMVFRFLCCRFGPIPKPALAAGIPQSADV